MALQYPKQIFCVWGRNHSSLSATFELVAPKETGGTPPLQMHEGNLSRFLVTLLDTSTGTTVPFMANIPATDVPILSKKTDIALFTKSQFSTKNTEDLPQCYSTKIRFGKFKDMSPAEVLLKDSDARKDLLYSKKLLEDNIDKYPKNKEIISAIDEAVLLLDAGELRPATTDISGQFEVYRRRCKSTRRANASGLFLCYNVSVVCQFGMNYPWLVSIDNYFAPSVNGKIDHEKAQGYKNASIRLSDDDWVYVLSQFENEKMMFEMIRFPELLKRANALALQQAEEAKARKAE